MKKLYNLVYIATAILLAFNATSRAQQSLTIAEVYDFEIGDLFHYSFHAQIGQSGMSSVTNIEIIERFYSIGNDTVFYIRDVDYKEITSDNQVWVFSYYTDTTFYTNLDQLINSGLIDTVFSNPEQYNGRSVCQWADSSMYDATYYKWVAGCGMAYQYYDGWEYGSYTNNSLVYYKKGDEEWGEPMLVGIGEQSEDFGQFLLFPNPCSIGTFHIQTTSDTPCQLTIIDASGQIVTSRILISSTSIDASNWPVGIYFVSLSHYNKRIITKLLIE
ncbi:MAG TPA: T9SS type A sorting domain-containing protein [Bacteroidales bacterium]|nr:T9SS type A sorting domain-containing protein [Bacteroidales bacterium]HRX98391.1 T9SS type A sorting domain-containing protein [Bacteroidales bacterium]